jgi:hypothetical protein
MQEWAPMTETEIAKKAKANIKTMACLMTIILFGKLQPG